MRPTHFVAASVAIAALLAVAGCGGSHKATPSAAKPPWTATGERHTIIYTYAEVGGKSAGVRLRLPDGAVLGTVKMAVKQLHRTNPDVHIYVNNAEISVSRYPALSDRGTTIARTFRELTEPAPDQDISRYVVAAKPRTLTVIDNDNYVYDVGFWARGWYVIIGATIDYTLPTGSSGTTTATTAPGGAP